MHIPDGFLSTPVWVTLDAVSLPIVGYLGRRAERGMRESSAPLLGVMGAFVFAAQMINFPVGIGTSGHMVGSALLACTLGPSAAVVVMTAILLVQALVFQDGGLLALGANVFNMGVAGVFAGYLPFRYLNAGSWRKAGVFLGGLLSVIAASCLALSELRFAGVPMPPAVLAVSLGLFLVSACIEGAITVAVFSVVERMNPAWVRNSHTDNRLLAVLGGSAIFLACVGALFASHLPDGLESFAAQVGIQDRAKALLNTPLADYEWRGLSDSWTGKAFAGLVGVAAISVIGVGLGRLLGRRGN